VELIVSITVLGVVMSLVGGISSSVAKYGRADDLRTKRNLALQQQANLVGALPTVSLTPTVLPASKSFRTGDFNYTRRISMSASTNPSQGTTTAITITIVPQTSTPSDSLKKESITLYRTSPTCGTALDVKSC
jgi:hypothetical protein